MVTCSIVLYKNDVSVLKHAINSFLDAHLELKLFLVDNSPTDDLKCCAADARVIYIHNPANPGFGAAHNIALKKALCLDAAYHLVLNPDVYFEKGTLEEIVRFMEAHPNVGHLMPKVLYPDQSFQPLCKRNPTFFDLFVRGFFPEPLKKLFARRMGYYLYEGHDFDQPIYDIPYLSGCFMFFRVSTLKKVGYFDDRIFMYLEDADITRRFLQVSNTVYYPGAIVYHHCAGLTHKSWKFKKITIQSAITYFNKWGWTKSII